MKIKMLFCFILCVLTYGCKSSKLPKNAFTNPLIPSLSPCGLVNVRQCRPQCETILNSPIKTIEQEISTGKNLSNFSVSVCRAQFAPIYRCFLIQAENNACEIINNLIKTNDFKMILENQDCQCNLLYT